MKAWILGALAATAISSAAMADKHGEAEAAKPVPDPVSFVTQHSGRFNGQQVRYRVEAGETYLRNADGEPTASFFTFSYIRDGAGADRPVTFIFNGGPGSASIWLHMGMFGPKRAVVASDADEDDGAAPYALVDNPDSPFDISDLVFIDPVGTGYSRAIGAGKGTDFWSQEGDTKSVAEFIRLWIDRHDRWNAPKYIAGESFGTMRAVQVAHELTTDRANNIALNGLALISNALDYEGSTSVHDNFYSYVTYLPTMAATARYHGRAGADVSLQDFIDQARAFARDEYAPALLKGAMMSADERRRIVDRLAYFTGLDTDYIDRSDLRILTGRFRKELLRDQGVAIGGLDSRYFVDEADDVAERPDGDAASTAISAAYTALLNHYMKASLGVEMERPYIVSSGEAGANWIYRPVPAGQRWEPDYVNVARKLSTAMRLNKDLKVWVANGIYDLVTPFFDADMTYARHGIPTERVAMTYYEAGHMMYVHEPSREAIMRDLRAFYAGELE
ncbi:MAG: peptidase S10 [Parvularculaceae bacterium]